MNNNYYVASNGFSAYLSKFLICSICFAVVFGCDEPNQSSTVKMPEDYKAKKRLISTIRGAGEHSDNDTFFVNLSEIIDIGYDSLKVFGGYHYVDNISKVINIDFGSETELGNKLVRQAEVIGSAEDAQLGENDCLFIYMDSGNIVSYFTFKRKHGDFLDIEQDKFEKEEMLFRMNKKWHSGQKEHWYGVEGVVKK